MLDSSDRKWTSRIGEGVKFNPFYRSPLPTLTASLFTLGKGEKAALYGEGTTVEMVITKSLSVFSSKEYISRWYR